MFDLSTTFIAVIPAHEYELLLDILSPDAAALLSKYLDVQEKPMGGLQYMFYTLFLSDGGYPLYNVPVDELVKKAEELAETRGEVDWTPGINPKKGMKDQLDYLISLKNEIHVAFRIAMAKGRAITYG
jgi:hypothetical protein